MKLSMKHPFCLLVVIFVGEASVFQAGETSHSKAVRRFLEIQGELNEGVLHIRHKRQHNFPREDLGGRATEPTTATTTTPPSTPPTDENNQAGNTQAPSPTQAPPTTPTTQAPTTTPSTQAPTPKPVLPEIPIVCFLPPCGPDIKFPHLPDFKFPPRPDITFPWPGKLPNIPIFKPRPKPGWLRRRRSDRGR